MEILISIAAKISEYTVAPIGRQVGYLIFYKDNIKELNDQIKELEGVKGRIKHSIEVERRNGRETEADVQNWLDRVDEITEKAKKLCEDPHCEIVGCSKWSFPNLKTRHQLSRNAKKMAKKVVEVQEKGKFDRVGYLPPLDVVTCASTIRGSEKLESRKKMKEDILLALRDSKVSKMGVYGLGGVGKTTLVKEVAKQIKDDEMFDAVVMANISQTPNLERIQGEIADLLGLHFEEMTTLGRARRLCERIKREKTILIILDDIWATLDLEKLGIPLEDEHKGCKLLLISRNQDILQKMESQKDFRLEVLNEEETWHLFEAMAGDINKEANLQNIATKVAKKCSGLPVVVVTMAKALRNKDIYCWKDALNQLERVGNEELNEIAYSALEFSYNQLDGDEVKEVFLLCGLLVINDVEYLLKLVIGLGMFEHINTVEDARVRFFKLINSLKASCLLLEGDTNEEVEMHDIVREVAISIASRDQHVFKIGRDVELNEWPKEDLLQKCPKIILEFCHIYKLPEKLDCPEVKLFWLWSENRSLGIPISLFEGMRNLRALNLINLDLPSLPMSLHSLTDLQTLSLNLCDLGDMANIGILRNLQILSLAGSSMKRLPSEVGQLTLLKMLDLSHSGIEVIPSNIISKLTKLEELYMGETFIKWEVENSNQQNKNATLAELRHLTNLTALEIQIQGAWILPRDLMFEKLERYKLFIGDKWEWDDDSMLNCSRLLKLKIGTSIHLEHGIKALIKRAENLYIDEIIGISNVLYHLNGEGFPLLKHLHIQNNANLQYIIDSKERNQTNVFFPKLETLILQNINKLEKLCHGPLTINSFGKLRVIKVKSCGQLEYLFSISIVKEFSQLLEIHVSECISMKHVVFVESTDSGLTIDKIEFIPLRSLTLQHLPRIDHFCSDNLASSNTPTFFNVKVAFPNLETLKLCAISLNKVWDDNQIFVAYSFQNLANLTVEDCDGLKYLFSPSMVESLKNLKRLEISKCHMMEEIIATEGRTNEVALEEVRFTKLEKITINDMKNLKTVWHYQFEGLKTLEVNKCEKLENVFPFDYMQKTLGSIETLKVSDCALVEEIFKLITNGMNREEGTAQLQNLILVDLPRMKQIWSRDPHGIVRFFNLQAVQIRNCQNLNYLFPFSVAKDLPQFENLKIISSGIKEIVSKKDGSMEGTPIFELNHLASLELVNLHNLKEFYAGPHTLECQLLKRLNVFNCKKLKPFDIQSNRHKEGSPVKQLQPLFIVEELISNLEELTLNCADANMILEHQVPWHLFCKLKLLRISKFEEDGSTFPYLFLQNVPNLKNLTVEWSSFKEIFYDEAESDKEGLSQLNTRLKKLTLFDLSKLQHICKEGYQIHPVLKDLKILKVKRCSSLRNLVPSSVSFYNLTYLEISNCNGLINLISSSTARSLVKLETMILKGCNSLEEIVTEEVDDTKSEIAFSRLEILELECLTRLNSFSCSKFFLKFPLLEKVHVRQCPRMKIFSARETSTPLLKKVLINEDDDEWCWEGDLNGTIKRMFLDQVAFYSLKVLELSKYPELKELWYGRVGCRKPFSNLKSLVVQNCDWLSNVLLSLNILQALSNLERLEVKGCDSLKAVFDLGGDIDRAKLVKETIPLRTITLSNLPKLKHIWKQNSQEIVSFGNSKNHQAGECHEIKMSEALAINIQPNEPLFLAEEARFSNLQVMRIEYCGNLEYLFPFYIAKDLAQLEDLKVISCGIEEIVSRKDEPTEGTPLFELNHLNSLELKFLHMLKGFYAGDHSLECQSLKNLVVLNCWKLKLFNIQSLFTAEVIGNLEELTINYRDANTKLQHEVPWHLFCKLKLLRFHMFNDIDTTFPHTFFQNVPILESLIVELSCFKEMFDDEIVRDKEGRNKFSTRLKKLNLFQLTNLQHICKEGCQIHPVLEVLEILCVKLCSSLTNLVPSSVTFYYLTYLKIEDCHKLINLITSSTARSLVKLETLELKRCNSLQEIVTEAVDDTKSEIAFSSLKVLELECLTMLKTFSSSESFLKFPLLEEVTVSQCARMETFSVSETSETSTPMLKKVLTEKKDEEWCWEGDLNRTLNKMFLNKVAFYSFMYLELSKYPELKELWYGPVGHKPFSNLKFLSVQQCSWLSNVLLSLDILLALSYLEELDVRNCDSLEAVFDLGKVSQKTTPVKEVVQLKKISLSNLSKLKHIWKQDTQEIISINLTKPSKDDHLGDEGQGLKMSYAPGCEKKGEKLPKQKQISSEDPQRILRFCNLKAVRVERCEGLEFLFPFSIAMDLECLERLEVQSCRIKEIVATANNEGPVERIATFVFNHLISLKLHNLNKLERFYAGNYSLTCQSLKELAVYDCNKLELFRTESMSSTERQVMDDDKSTAMRPSMQQPLFVVEEVIPKVEQLTVMNLAGYITFGPNWRKPVCKGKRLRVSNFAYEEAALPNWLLQSVSNMETLAIESSSFKKIFEDERQSRRSATQVKYLTLNRLPQLQHLCKEGTPIDHLEVLESLYVEECCSLINLVPSFVSFSHLTSLKVANCNSLITLIASSTARSLVKLKEMVIRRCDLLEQIVTEEGDVTKEEIAFSSLEVLKLECLPRLIRFSSSECFLQFPLLKKIVVTQCLRMKVFSINKTSTPQLQKVLLVDRNYEKKYSSDEEKEDEEWYWENDLNETIKKMFMDMVALHSFKHLKLSEYPELKELWYNQVENKRFCNLKSLVVHKCDFLSGVLFSLNLLQLLETLKKLEVRDCDSLEALFDLKSMDEQGIHVKKASQLEELTLSDLPNLKLIWNKDSQEILSFENLQVVEVAKCQNLIHLFSVSQCRDLGQLEKLHIESCGIEQIVAMEEVWEELRFDFPHLITLKLFCLTKLKSFYPGRHTLECPLLETLDVYLCEALQIFSFDHYDFQHHLVEVEFPHEQALFFVEKVSPNLKELTLNDKDAMRILNGHYDANLFHCIKMLHLQYFQETSIMFLNDLLERFPNTMTIQLRYCSFETLFHSEGIDQCKSRTQIMKILWLYQLEQLKHIWSDDSLSDPSAQNLESLRVVDCSSLKCLAPPSISFKNLTTLEVKDCKGLIYLMKSSTARSLMQLTSLTIKNCEMLEEVVMIDEGESEEEIKFERLVHLKLTSLSSFRSFCSGKHTFIFSSLKDITVTGCPKMQNFSSGVIIAPILKIVEVENGKKYWTEDLNTTLRQLFIEKVVPDSDQS